MRALIRIMIIRLECYYDHSAPMTWGNFHTFLQKIEEDEDHLKQIEEQLKDK